MASDALGYRGLQQPTDGTSDYNAISFIVWQILRTVAGARLVEVQAVTNSGGVSPVGFVDVLPLVNQLDGSKNAVPHETVHNLPYFRLQGGTNAVIIDPQVGDIGVAIIEDRDISSVKTNKAQANPGSERIFDMADGLYLGGFLNGTPTQYFQFSTAGIAIVSPTKISMSAPTIVLQATQSIGITAGTEITNSAPAVEIDGQLTQGQGPHGGDASMEGPLSVINDVTGQGKSLHGHTHLENGAGSQTNPPT